MPKKKRPHSAFERKNRYNNELKKDFFDSLWIFRFFSESKTRYLFGINQIDVFMIEQRRCLDSLLGYRHLPNG
ncbi:hypothetical protein CVN76_13860 [Bacillus sp. mrc49]|nr:hypothetical protein CVN76_13860 [Bacillus sp. mrc49]